MAFITSKAGTAKAIQANSISVSAIGDAYAVDGFEPELAFDFTGETYRTDGSATTFSGAMTHSATSLGTMTDGYGPERWARPTISDPAVWSWDGTTLTATGDGTNDTARGPSVTAGLMYSVSFTSTANGSGLYQVRLGNTFIVTLNSSTGGDYSYIVKPADSTGLTFTDSGSTDAVLSNISVRELPAIKWRPHNLLTYSEDFSNAAWDKTNTTVTANQAVAPDGTATADKVTVNSASVSYVRDFLSIDAYTHTFGVFAKAGTTSSIQVYVIQQGVTSGTADVDLSDGTVSSVAGAWTGGVTATDVGDGWYFIEGTRTFTASASNHGVGVAATGQNGLDFYIWGAHLYRSDLGGMVDNPDRGDSYVPTTSAAVYLPRRGHYVYNGQEWTNRGLLLESEARTNLITYSIPDTNWSPIRASVSEGVALAPDGTMTASKGVEDTSTSATHRVDFDLTVTDGSSYSWSVFAKAAERDSVAMEIGAGSISASYARFDLSSGVVAEEVGGAIGYIEDFGNGWYRCTVNGLAGVTDRVLIGICDGATQSYTGDGTSGIYLWGAQLEEDSTSSSYMPTNGATFTRAAETLTVAAADLPSTISPSGSKAALVTAGWTITDGGAV